MRKIRSQSNPRTAGPIAQPSPGLSLVAAAALMLLSACGGGGDSPAQIDAGAGSNTSSAPNTPATPSPVILAGVAATGAPMSQAAVKVNDKLGVAVCDTVTDAEGKYSCTLPDDAKAPFAVAVRSDDLVLYSTTASEVSATVNVTPLTSLIVARLTPNGDPAQFAQGIKNDPRIADAGKIEAQVREVKALIAPLLAAVGDSIDPIAGSFKADGKGHDRVLDALQVTIRPDGAASNIELTVKTLPASDDSAPLRIAFKSTDDSPSPMAGVIDVNKLPDDDVAVQVNGLMGRLTACYAHPLTARVANVADGAASAVGGAGDVKAAECKSLFLNSDPAQYKENGFGIGSSGHFSGMWRDGATGVKFDRGNFEYQWANGDAYVTYRTTTRDGAVAYQASTVRRQNGRWVVVGNQYTYDASVRAYATDREMPFQPEFKWFGTGYNVSIANKLDAQGQPLFKEAISTDPNGRKLTLRPLAGRSTMLIVRPDDTQSPNQIQFFATAYQDKSLSGSPQAKDPVHLIDTPLSDAQILGLPNQGVWTIEWVHADSSKPNMKQAYRTISRAPTIGEVRLQPFAQMTTAFRNELLASSGIATQHKMLFGAPDAGAPNVAAMATADGGDAWIVPDGALVPSSVTVFGRTADGQSFNDSASVGYLARSTRIVCAKKSAADLHCDNSTGVTQFAEGAYYNFFTFWGRNGRQVELEKLVALYSALP